MRCWAVFVHCSSFICGGIAQLEFDVTLLAFDDETVYYVPSVRHGGARRSGRHLGLLSGYPADQVPEVRWGEAEDGCLGTLALAAWPSQRSRAGSCTSLLHRCCTRFEGIGASMGTNSCSSGERRGAWAQRSRGSLSEEVTGTFVAMWTYYDRYGLPTGSAPLAWLLGRPGRSFAEVLRRSMRGSPRVARPAR